MTDKQDYRKFFDKELFGAWDIPGADVVMTIATAGGGELTGQGGRKTKKPMIGFVGTDKKFAINATNGKTIAGMYGVYVQDWVGKKIALYKTTTQMGGETMDCVRIRPQIPGAAKGGASTDLTISDLHGEVQSFTKGSDWLAAFEKMLNETADHEAAGKLWDANMDAFYDIQASAAKSKNAQAIDRCAAVGALAQQKMANPEQPGT